VIIGRAASRETAKADLWLERLMGAGIQTDRYQVKEDEKVSLERRSPADTSGFSGTEGEALEESRKLSLKLERLQEILYAEHKHKVLIVLQAGLEHNRGEARSPGHAIPQGDGRPKLVGYLGRAYFVTSTEQSA